MTLSDEALVRLATRFAIFLRLGSAVACLIAAPLAAMGPVSTLGLAVVLVGLVAWAGVFAFVLVWWGPSLLVIVTDTALVTCVVVAQEQLAPVAMISDGTTWTLMLASTVVFIAQLTLRPLIGLAVASIVIVAYIFSTETPTGVLFLPLQALVVIYLVGLLRRGGSSADQVIAASLSELHRARLQEARRADEREQFRKLHDTVLSTLVMVASGAFDSSAAVVSDKARDGLAVFAELGAAPRSQQAHIVLIPLLTTIAERAVPLKVRVRGAAPLIPAHVAEGLGGAVAEALENVIRHAGVDKADVTVRTDGAVLIVEVADAGVGFDPAEVSDARRGIKESVVGRLAAVGGTATVTTRPSLGTTVVLRWPRD